MPQDQFARLLSPLMELRTLQVHLDLTSTPIPTFDMQYMERYGMSLDYDHESLNAFAHDQHMVAEVCARILSPSIENIYVWSPNGVGHHVWRMFRVERPAEETQSKNGIRVVHQANDDIFADFLGI